jgi:hypothetical protein
VEDLAGPPALVGGVVVEEAGRPGDLRARLADRLALLADDDRRQLVAVVADACGDRAQGGAALDPAHARPRGLRALGGLERAVDVLGARLGRLPDHGLVGGVDDVARLGRGDPLTADVHHGLLCGDGHVCHSSRRARWSSRAWRITTISRKAPRMTVCQ